MYMSICEYVYMYTQRYVWTRVYMHCIEGEAACMSTSQEKAVVVGYASSKQPLLFRIKFDTQIPGRST